MTMARRVATLVALLFFTAGVGLAVAQSGAGLITDGTFDASKSSKELRADAKGPDWYESRRDQKGSRLLLMLSNKPIAGNATPKAMIKGDPKFNTYLTQRFATPQTGDFTLTYDVLVKEILPPFNRSAFCMIGSDKDKKGGANSTGVERFVFLGFEKGAVPGKMNLFAREGNKAWEQKTIVAKDLDLDKWYTVEVTVYAEAGVYEVGVKGVTPQPKELDAFRAGKKPIKRLTHVSFASWNDGPGTFYIDNVIAKPE